MCRGFDAETGFHANGVMVFSSLLNPSFKHDEKEEKGREGKDSAKAAGDDANGLGDVLRMLRFHGPHKVKIKDGKIKVTPVMAPAPTPLDALVHFATLALAAGGAARAGPCLQAARPAAEVPGLA